jgi:pantothenate kinase-related protein Tda10
MLWKILLLVALVATVWFGFAAWRRHDERRVTTRPQDGMADRRPSATVDLKHCAVCGQFVGGDAPACERSGCPRRRQG